MIKHKVALLAVGGGGLSGGALGAALTGSPVGVILVYVAAFPLVFVGLGFGSGAFGLTAATGLAVALAFGGLTAAGLYGGMHVIPSWLIVQQALRPSSTSPDGWRPAGHVLAVLTLLIAFVVACTSWAGRGQGGIEEEVRQLLSAVAHMAAPGLGEADQQALAERLTPLFLGLSAVTWLVMIVANAGLAQSLLVARGWNTRPAPHWSRIRLPGWFDWVLVGTAATALVGSGDASFLARNIFIILLAPYFFVGVAVVHVVAQRTPTPRLILSGFYVLLVLFFLVGAGLVAALGIIEQWIGVRGRLAVGGPPLRKE